LRLVTLERGLVRLPMLDVVAEVLGVDPAVLTESTAATQAAHSVDQYEVQAIRAALGKYPALSTGSAEPVGLAPIRSQASYLDHAWQASRFTVVARHLPKLMADTQNAVLTVSAREQGAAYRVLVTTYRLASSMLLKFEANDLAWLAADRAMYTALQLDDTWSLARATRSVARAMSSARQQAESFAALIGMADRMRSEVKTDEHNLLSLYGMLFLAASITAAGQSNAAWPGICTRRQRR
jgi:hypothetical protein